MTVKQNIEFPLRRIKKDLTQNKIDEKVKEVLEHVGLSDALDKCRRNSPAECANASAWRGPLWLTRRYCYTMNPPPG